MDLYDLLFPALRLDDSWWFHTVQTFAATSATHPDRCSGVDMHLVRLEGSPVGFVGRRASSRSCGAVSFDGRTFSVDAGEHGWSNRRGIDDVELEAALTDACTRAPADLAAQGDR